MDVPMNIIDANLWNDDSRINGLFAPFRSKSINPVDWESKLKFWQDAIEQYCLQCKTGTFCLEDLQRTFSRKGKEPACLETVILEMLRCGAIVPAEAYKNYSLMRESYSEWATRLLVKSPMLWAFNKITSPFAAKKDAKIIDYANLKVCKKLSEELIEKLPKNSVGRLIDIKELVEIGIVKDEESLKIVLRPLIEQKRAAVAILPSAVLIKFAKEDEKLSSISDIDFGVYELEKNEQLLQNNIETLEAEKEAALKEVKTCLAKNRRQMAKIWLRRKNELEKYIDKRASALDNVQALLHRIKQAKTDSLVLDAYNQGLIALKETFRVTGLTEKKAEDTMDELEDVLDVHNEIEATLAKSLDPADDSTLEDELAELLLDTAPDVPPAAPSFSGDAGFGNLIPSTPIDVQLAKDSQLPGLSELQSLPSVEKLPNVPTVDDVLEARIKALAL